MSDTGWRPWLPEGIAALMVLAIGFTEAVLTWAMTGGRMEGFAQALAIAFAVGMCRRAPGAALGLVWGLGLFHVLFGAPIMLIEFALTAVFFACAVSTARTPAATRPATATPARTYETTARRRSRRARSASRWACSCASRFLPSSSATRACSSRSRRSASFFARHVRIASAMTSWKISYRVGPPSVAGAPGRGGGTIGRRIRSPAHSFSSTGTISPSGRPT